MSRFAAAELELRQVPGVRFVSITGTDDEPIVQVIADPDKDDDEIRDRVREIVHLRLTPDATVRHVASMRTRVQLVAVRAVNGNVEVELAHGGRRAVGTAENAEPAGVVRATLDALYRLGAPVPFRFDTAASFEHGGTEGTLVVLRDGHAGQRFGVATGARDLSMARATLSALNRHLGAALPA